MLAWVFSVLGEDPSYIIGGVARNLGTNARAGTGKLFVIEADEYDRMFLGIQPYLAIITNIEHDHPDCYPTEEEFYRAFIDFAKGLAIGGILILCSEDKNALKLYEEVKNQPTTRLLYGKTEIRKFEDNGYWVKGCGTKQIGYDCHQVTYQKNPIAELNLQIRGDHNVLNATAVVAATHQLGLPMKEVEQALKEFQGSGRRLEIKGFFKG
jgi:UDP-N-acetylmuramate--alanine ligase